MRCTVATLLAFYSPSVLPRRLSDCFSVRNIYAQEPQSQSISTNRPCAIAGRNADPAINLGGRLTLVAGGGTGGDVTTARQAKLVAPFGVGFDGQGTLFFVEMTGHRVRKIGRDGLVTTVAGTGREGSGGDGGPAAKAELNGPHSLAVAKNGDIFVADTWNNRVRKIDARTGVITNFAGTGRKGFSGDGGPAAGGGVRRDLLPGPRRGESDALPGGSR